MRDIGLMTALQPEQSIARPEAAVRYFYPQSAE
jgi:hypothetical protein